jgi:selenobiotic family peptide radical SAM maturase
VLRERWFGGRKTSSFTLQWHLTNSCELSCAHCYDRTKRGAPTLGEAERILGDLVAFCRRRRVRAQVCLTGGNPLRYPHFFDIYRSIAARGIPASILGNPATREEIAEIVAIGRPTYYQVSLEGRREQNDSIRGRGHFDRAIAFLHLLREFGVRSVVMLTLTRANIDEVLPLAETLRGVADRFTFNRLSQVGHGAALSLPTPPEFRAFLMRYTMASKTNPAQGFKDNLFNILRDHHRRPLTRGCTGYGCGAAFNFVALLPDGEVHACRKFPSPLGNIRDASFDALWGSRVARRYRDGSLACRGCRLRNVCQGCPAVTFGAGLRPLEDRDPYCFIDGCAAIYPPQPPQPPPHPPPPHDDPHEAPHDAPHDDIPTLSAFAARGNKLGTNANAGNGNTPTP